MVHQNIWVWIKYYTNATFYYNVCCCYDQIFPQKLIKYPSIYPWIHPPIIYPRCVCVCVEDITGNVRVLVIQSSFQGHFKISTLTNLWHGAKGLWSLLSAARPSGIWFHCLNRCPSLFNNPLLSKWHNSIFTDTKLHTEIDPHSNSSTSYNVAWKFKLQLYAFSSI